MATAARLILEFRYIDFEGDGSPCHDCGDPIFFMGRALQGFWEHDGKKAAHPVKVFCASCADCRENKG